MTTPAELAVINKARAENGLVPLRILNGKFVEAGRKAGPNRRQTIYRVQWSRGTSSAKSRLFTKRAAALAFIQSLRDPDDRYGRGVRPLNFCRLFTGSVVWDDIEGG